MRVSGRCSDVKADDSRSEGSFYYRYETVVIRCTGNEIQHHAAVIKVYYIVELEQ